VEVDVLLDLVDDRVAVRSFLPERDIGALAGPVAVDEENPGGQVGAVVTGETFGEVQDEVQECGRPAGCDHVAGIDDHPVNGHVHCRVAAL
jgi:hypothetical protein